MSLNYFDKILYINLNQREDRKNHILSQLSKLKVKKDKIVRIPAHFVLANGHLGCLKSHIDALDFAIKNELSNYLVLEDDVYFLDDIKFIDATIDYFLKIVNPWDVFLLGGFFYETQKSPYPYINKVIKSTRSHAYAVNKNYFQTLKDHFLKNLKILQEYEHFYDIQGNALDVYWNALQRKDLWYSSNVLISGQIEDFSDIMWKTKYLR